MYSSNRNSFRRSASREGSGGTIKKYRAVALLCRQRAALCPQASWHWLAEAERYEDLAEAEVEAHFKECNGGVEFDANLAAA
jgi:hypothetical protein